MRSETSSNPSSPEICPNKERWDTSQKITFKSRIQQNFYKIANRASLKALFAYLIYPTKPRDLGTGASIWKLIRPIHSPSSRPFPVLLPLLFLLWPGRLSSWRSLAAAAAADPTSPAPPPPPAASAAPRERQRPWRSWKHRWGEGQFEGRVEEMGGEDVEESYLFWSTCNISGCKNSTIVCVHLQLMSKQT